MNIQLRRVTLADQFIDTKHLLQHEGEYYVLAVGVPTLADDLRELLTTIRTELKDRTGSDRIDLGLVAERVAEILRKHGEAEE